MGVTGLALFGPLLLLLLGAAPAEPGGGLPPLRAPALPLVGLPGCGTTTLTLASAGHGRIAAKPHVTLPFLLLWL
jgi:hypothetical protein